MKKFFLSLSLSDCKRIDLDISQWTSEELINELNQIHLTLHTLDQFFQEQLTQIPTSDVDLLVLFKQHKVRICFIDPIRKRHMDDSILGERQRQSTHACERETTERSFSSNDCFIDVIKS